MSVQLRHVAIILDGNHRWARQQGIQATYGHQHGVSTLRRVVTHCCELAIPELTVFAFSTENWHRDSGEVAALLSLMEATLRRDLPELSSSGVCLTFFGQLHRLPASFRSLIDWCAAATHCFCCRDTSLGFHLLATVFNTLPAACSPFACTGLDCCLHREQFWKGLELVASRQAGMPGDQRRPGLSDCWAGEPTSSRLAPRNVQPCCRAQAETSGNTRLHLSIALSYGGRQDIVQAARQLARLVESGMMHADDIDESAFQTHLWTHQSGCSAPDLLIRCAQCCWEGAGVFVGWEHW
jgi:undecaprenyl pyrophosphate synthase